MAAISSVTDASGAFAPHAGGARRTTAKPALETRGAVFCGDRRVEVRDLELEAPGPGDVVVDVEWCGVSSGTERLMYTGEMPMFPGMGYPLVPGYEAVGKVVWADRRNDLLGKRVFAPGSKGFRDARGLFGASASRLVVDAERVAPADFAAPEQAALLALAATAHHAVVGGRPPDLVVGHGVFGRLIARVSIALGHPPPVAWEIDDGRADADGYAVIDPSCDGRSDYTSIYEASGDETVVDELVAAMAKGGEIVLAGFYPGRIGFSFAPAFIKEARMRIAAEWSREDLEDVIMLVETGKLSLDGLITHVKPAAEAADAYAAAFGDPDCLKMLLDWRG
ncbi:MAG: chlorophyll synthesis pathway protein BchC [Pseudomonadota bacterium]